MQTNAWGDALFIPVLEIYTITTRRYIQPSAKGCTTPDR